MGHVDLDELAEARREALGEAPSITFKGETFALPVELPIAVVEAWMDDADAVTFGKALFGEDWDRFRALGPSQQDVFDLGARLGSLWGVSEGESSASGSSSEVNGEGSRPTSSASTAKTSAKRSGAKKRTARAASSR